MTSQDVVMSFDMTTRKGSWYKRPIRKFARWVLKAELEYFDTCYKYQINLGKAHLKIIDGFQYGQNHNHDLIEALYSLAWAHMKPRQRKEWELELGHPVRSAKIVYSLNRGLKEQK